MMGGFTIPGFDEDYYFGDESDLIEIVDEILITNPTNTENEEIYEYRTSN